jgi:hypothetical protein
MVIYLKIKEWPWLPNCLTRNKVTPAGRLFNAKSLRYTQTGFDVVPKTRLTLTIAISPFGTDEEHSSENEERTFSASLSYLVVPGPIPRRSLRGFASPPHGALCSGVFRAHSPTYSTISQKFMHLAALASGTKPLGGSTIPRRPNRPASPLCSSAAEGSTIKRIALNRLRGRTLYDARHLLSKGSDHLCVYGRTRLYIRPIFDLRTGLQC